LLSKRPKRLDGGVLKAYQNLDDYKAAKPFHSQGETATISPHFYAY